MANLIADAPTRMTTIRLRRSTWPWIGSVLAIWVIVLVPGEHAQPIWRCWRIEHGWPLIYLVRDVQPSNSGLWSVTHGVAEFRPWALLANLIVCVASLVVVARWRESKAKSESSGPRWYTRLPWRFSLDGFLISSVVAAWSLEQTRLADGNASEARALACLRTHFGDDVWWFLPVALALCSVIWFYRRRTTCNLPSISSDLAQLVLTLLLGAGLVGWIVVRSRHVYGAAVPMLVDLAALLLLGSILSGSYRRWRRRRAKRPVSHEPRPWQFSLRGLLIATSVAALFVAAGVETARFANAIRLVTADDRRPPFYPAFLRPLLSLPLRLGQLDGWREFYKYEPPADDENITRLRYLMQRYPDAVVLSVVPDLEPGQRASLSKLSNIRFLDLEAGLDVPTLAALTELDQLQWLVARFEQEHTREQANAVDRLMERNHRLVGVMLYGKTLADEDLQRVARIGSLQRLHVTWNPSGYWHLLADVEVQYNGRWPERARGPASDEGLRPLARLTSLESLRLEGTHIRGPGLAHLHGLPRLRHLAIENAPLDDAGVAYVNGCSRLFSLSLARTEIRSLAAIDWAGLPHLQVVELSETDIALPELKRLRREHPQIEFRHAFYEQLDRYYDRRQDSASLWSPPTRNQLWAIQPLTDLTTLNLSSSNIDDSDLSALEPLTVLQQLLLDRTRISEAGLTHLRCLGSIEWLDLQDTNVADLACLRNAVNIRQLWLCDSSVGDDAMAHLSSLTSLEYVSLGGTRVTSRGFEALDYHPMLSEISLDASIVDTKLIQTLQTMPSLRCVWLDHHNDYNAAGQTAVALQKQLPEVLVGLHSPR